MRATLGLGLPSTLRLGQRLDGRSVPSAAKHSCGNAGRSLNLSEPQFLISEMGVNNSSGSVLSREAIKTTPQPSSTDISCSLATCQALGNSYGLNQQNSSFRGTDSASTERQTPTELVCGEDSLGTGMETILLLFCVSL